MSPKVSLSRIGDAERERRRSGEKRTKGEEVRSVWRMREKIMASRFLRAHEISCRVTRQEEGEWREGEGGRG